ncbi:MAG: hypothetical protein AAF609_26850 [Cyanobacteria bacterium P01_C01_bin.120]
MAISTYLMQQIVDLVFGGTDYVQPTTISVELWNATAETTYTGYVAQTLTVGTTDFAAAVADGVDHSISPANAITFPGPTADPSSEEAITRVRLYDDESTPNLLWEIPLDASKILSQGDDVTISQGDLDLKIGGSCFSDAVEAAVLNHIFRGVDYTAPANLFFDIYDDGAVPATNGTGGTLTDYGSYAQQSVTNNTTNFPNGTVNASNVEKATGAAINFPDATGNATNNAGEVAVWAEAARTNLVAIFAFTAKPIQNGDTVSIPSGQQFLTITPSN